MVPTGDNFQVSCFAKVLNFEWCIELVLGGCGMCWLRQWPAPTRKLLVLCNLFEIS